MYLGGNNRLPILCHLTAYLEISHWYILLTWNFPKIDLMCSTITDSTLNVLVMDLSKEGCKDQESIQLSTTPDPEYQWESDKLTADTTNESQEVSPFPAGDHKAHINRRAQRHNKHKTEQKHKRSTKEAPPWNGQ